MENYDMSKAPGRMYKYYTGEPLFRFGHGLSYTNFDIQCMSASASVVPVDLTCKVTNEGHRRGDEVVMMFHNASSDVRSQANHPVPQRALIGFDRVTLGPGESKDVSFSVTEESVALIDENGEPRKYPGIHHVIFSRGHGGEQVVDVRLG